MARKYHHLITRESDGLWYPQFGDYDKSVVKQEVEDCYGRDQGHKKKDVKVVTTADGQQALTEFLADLNAEEVQKDPRKGERLARRMGGEA